MPFFNFRRSQSGTTNAPPESMDVIRRRAKHRLIGSAVLVLAGVVGFPLLFDTQPRPIAVDTPIEIPNKNTVKPLSLPAKPDGSAQTNKATGGSAPVAAQSSLTPKEEIVADSAVTTPSTIPKVLPKAQALPAQVSPGVAAPKKEAKADPKPEPAAPKPEVKPPAKPEAKPEPKPQAKTEEKLEPKPQPKVDDGARAKALLNGQTPVGSTAPADERFIVQVGAFAEQAKAQEARQKLERAGLKTYTQVAETPSGKRIRVRVGPFASRADADSAANKIKKLDLPAAILTL